VINPFDLTRDLTRARGAVSVKKNVIGCLPLTSLRDSKEEGPPEKGPCFCFSLPDFADLMAARYEKLRNPSTHIFPHLGDESCRKGKMKKAVPKGAASLTGRAYADPCNDAGTTCFILAPNG
jgi:hypothetical protein